MSKRSRLQIYFDVLEVVAEGTSKPTQIMYGTNLSWNTLNKVFEVLVNSKFLRKKKTNTSKKFYITTKGKQALSYYRRSIADLVTAPHTL
jgi:predicted transcriptional regulator